VRGPTLCTLRTRQNGIQKDARPRLAVGRPKITTTREHVGLHSHPQAVCIIPGGTTSWGTLPEHDCALPSAADVKMYVLVLPVYVPMVFVVFIFKYCNNNVVKKDSMGMG
jgi:hypothetical protein